MNLARAQDLLARLVAFATVSRDSNRALIDFVEAHLKGLGATTRIVPGKDGKASLFARLGPKVPGGVVLSGHTDVVPVDDQPWSSDPFVMLERDGRLYGRGTADMKGFIACALAQAEAMARCDLVRPVMFALSHDEEVGCLAAPDLIAAMAGEPAPVAVIVGEPTGMEVVNAHKGFAINRTEVIGKEAHSSQTHQGASAVLAAARLIAKLGEWNRDNLAQADAANGFTPPHSSINVGVVQGGIAVNIIARACAFVWDTRVLPKDPPAQTLIARLHAWGEAEVLAPMRAIDPSCLMRTETLSNSPGLAANPDGAAERLAMRLSGHNRAQAVAFATEAGLFQGAGFDTVVCGPGHIAQAHQPDEYLAISELAACMAFLARLTEHLQT